MCYKYLFGTIKKMNIINKANVEFSLEQVTPMLHFQGEEKLAGIRASDLKPRFDVFLKKYWYDLKTEGEKEEIKSCILKKNEEEINNNPTNVIKRISFDYKVKVFNSGDKIYGYNPQNKKNLFYGSFYGKLADDKFSFYNEVKVSFLLPHEGLRESIQELFPVFLAVNGFGLRNNKGYGYFKLKEKTKEEILEDIQKYQKMENAYIEGLELPNKDKGVGIYQLQIENKISSKYKNVQNILEDIKFFHQILKSGLNTKNNRYIPSFMLKRYKRKEGILFEKKSLKLFLNGKKYDIRSLTKNDNSMEEDLNNKELYYVRGLLGLAPFYEFREVKTEDGRKITAKFKVKIKGVERFPSPIKYLPVSHEEIIILVDYSKIEEFRKMSYKKNGAVFSLCKTSSQKKLQIPSEEQYSIHKLFKQHGIIDNGISEIKCKETENRIRKWRYGVISDIEIGKVRYE